MVQIRNLVDYKMITSQQKIGGPYNASNRKFDALQNDSNPVTDQIGNSKNLQNGSNRKFDGL